MWSELDFFECCMCGYKTKSWKDTVTLFKHRIDEDKKKAPHKLFSSKSARRSFINLAIKLFFISCFISWHSDAESIHQSMQQSNYTKVVTKHIQVSFCQRNVTHVCLSICSRHFISFPSCWFCCTHGSQRAQSRGGEQDPQKNRMVRWWGVCYDWEWKQNKTKSFKFIWNWFSLSLALQDGSRQKRISLVLYAIVW